MAQTQTAPVVPIDFVTLLDRAVHEPGVLSEAFRTFHGYSLGNQLLAFFQCRARGITPGPIATFMGWKDKGRSVRKGEKAIVLCMPVTCRRQADDDVEDTSTSFTRFVYKPRWFVLAQTDGADVAAETLPTWDRARALAALDITEKPFDLLDGNVQGYAQGRTVAISPVAAEPHETLFHEVAHILLGHTTEGETLRDEACTPRSLREVEAEAVALVCLEALDLPGAPFCRGYIQHWNAQRGAAPISERSAQKIFKAADAILRAGRADVDELRLRAA